MKRDVLLATPEVIAPELLPTGISQIADNAGNPVRHIYGINGQAQSQLKRGINIVRERTADGKVRVVKVLVK